MDPARFEWWSAGRSTYVLAWVSRKVGTPTGAGPGLRRRHFTLCVVPALSAMLVGGWAHPAFAEDVTLPANLQAQLIAKVSLYDRNFRERTGDRARVAIAAKPSSLASMRDADLMKTAFVELRDIDGTVVEPVLLSFTGAAALATECKARRISILYVTQGFDREIAAIRGALDGLPVMTVGPFADYARNGIVLGIQRVEGRPRLFVHLEQSKKQGLRLASSLLNIVTVYR